MPILSDVYTHLADGRALGAVIAYYCPSALRLESLKMFRVGCSASLAHHLATLPSSYPPPYPLHPPTEYGAV